jgi:4-alpha-glucanotransferase
MSETLLELARAHGILLDYHDIWGQQHHAAEHSLRAILRAMGVAADDDEAARAALAAAERTRWLQMLEPAIVARTRTDPWPVTLRLPADALDTELRWWLQEENGPVHQGRLRPAELPVRERGSVDGAEYVALEWPLALPAALGYHRLSVRHGERTAQALLAVAPARCYAPPALRSTAMPIAE